MIQREARLIACCSDQANDCGVIMRIPHELQDEFPDETVLITRPTETNYLFRRLAGRYDEINRQVRISSRRKTRPRTRPSKRLNKRRLKLKDQIIRMF